MNCTCHAYPNPDCPRHGWREDREMDPVMEDRLARAEAVGIVIWAGIFAVVFAICVAAGVNALAILIGGN